MKRHSLTNGPVRRWTAAWALQLIRRFHEDTDYRRSVAIRAARLARTGRIDPIAQMTTPRDVDALFQAYKSHLPVDLRDVFDRADDYSSWLRVNQFTSRAHEDLKEQLQLRQDRLPLISLITPVYNTPEDLLRELVDSVLGQIHSGWELCLVDDASTATHIATLLHEFQQRDPRIRVLRRPENGGISLATNSGADMARGEALAFLDHDDLITPDCVAELAIAYADNPEADIVYSDNDKIDMQNKRFEPQFKPHWSPSLLLSYMYICHIFSVRRSLYVSEGGFLKGYDGSQDFDFALRASETARKIVHIPRVLYHWRTAPGSTAVSGGAKPESLGAGLRAVRDATLRRGISAEPVHPTWASSIQLGHFELVFGHSGPSVSILVDDADDPQDLQQCLKSIETTKYADIGVEVVEANPSERLSKRMNRAAELSTSDFLVFLTSRARIRDPFWLSKLIGWADVAGAGAVGPKLVAASGRVVAAGYHIATDGAVYPVLSGSDSFSPGPGAFLKVSRECAAISAACLLTRRTDFISLFGFSDAFTSAHVMGADYSLRLSEHGKSVLCCGNTEVWLQDDQEDGTTPASTERLDFSARLPGQLDPYYNPNLRRSTFSFAPTTRRLPARSNRPRRVAFMSHNLDEEGAPITFKDLVIGLKQASEVNPIVLSPRDGPIGDVFRRSGVDVEIVAEPPLDEGTAAFDQGVDRLSQCLARVGAEVVVANTLQTFYAVHAARAAGLSAIWCQHESGRWRSYFDYLPAALRPRAYAAFPLAYRVTYVADATRRDWMDLCLRDNFQTIPHAVPDDITRRDLERWTRASARETLDVQESEFVVLTVGSVSERKGQLDLVQAFGHLSDELRAKARVILVGPLNDAAYLKQIHLAIDSLKPADRAHIDIRGAVDEVAPYYRAADIFVCTSRIESAPRAISEAMSFGLPILATPVFGIPEMVDADVNALFFEPGATMTLAAHIDHLHASPARRKAMAAASPEVLSKRPDFNAMIRSYAQLLREAQLAT